jgi:hypothetical protein
MLLEARPDGGRRQRSGLHGRLGEGDRQLAAPVERRPKRPVDAAEPAAGRPRVRRDRQRERVGRPVEDDGAGGRVHVRAHAPGPLVELRAAGHDDAGADDGGGDPSQEHGLVGQHEVVDLHHRVGRTGVRAQDRGVAAVFLRPLERLLVEPADLAVELEPEPQLAEVLGTVGVGPPQAQELAPRPDGGEERAVADQRAC